MKRIILAVGFCVSALALSGCVGGGVAGAAGSAVASNALSAGLTSGSNKARFGRMTCEQLDAEIKGARSQMLSPFAVMSASGYIRDAQEVAKSKGCAI